MTQKKLSDLQVGEEGIISSIDIDPDGADQLWELGVGPGEAVRFVGRSPFGDPIVVEVMNYRLSLRMSEANKIFLHPPSPGEPKNRRQAP